MKKNNFNKLVISKSTIANLDAVYAGGPTDPPDKSYLLCLSAKATCRCITPATQMSYCPCNSVDINCPTGNPPMC